MVIQTDRRRPTAARSSITPTEPTPNKRLSDPDIAFTALAFGRAIAHVFIAHPVQCARMFNIEIFRNEIRHFLVDEYSGVDSASLDLFAICFGLSQTRLNRRGVYDEESMGRACRKIKGLEHNTVTMFSALLKLSSDGVPFELLSSEDMLYPDGVFNLVCLELVELLDGVQSPPSQRVADVWSARNGEDLVRYMELAVRVHDRQLQSESGRKRALQLHTRLLSTSGRCHTNPVLSISTGPSMFQFAIEHISYILHLFDSAPSDQRHASEPETKTTEDAFERLHRAYEATPWDAKLLKDSMVGVQTLRTELRAYAVQLLLCLDYQSLFGPNQLFVRTDLLVAFIEVAVRLEGEITKVTDMVDMLRMLSSRFLRIHASQAHSDGLVNFSTLASPLKPLVLRALCHTSWRVVTAAHGFLQAIAIYDHDCGSHSNSAICSDLPTVIDEEVARTVVRSIVDNLEEGNPLCGETVMERHDEPNRRHIGWHSLLRWLAEFVVQQPSSVELKAFEESGIVPFFVCTVSEILHMSPKADSPHWGTAAWVTLLFLRTFRDITWSGASSSGDQGKGRDSPAMSEFVYRTFAQYLLTQPTPFLIFESDHEAMELYQRAFAFIEYALLFRPVAARSCELDIACEEIAGTILSDPRLEHMVPCISDATMAYMYTRHLRDTVGKGWWKFGGLSQACGASTRNEVWKFSDLSATQQ
ncbi:hypothetical protein FRB95_002058 [Tulasnella sp. JGI-2019a]|nr:hypothetical protein FRB95_002058 [Tulasnella sp. JGI-2019a]